MERSRLLKHRGGLRYVRAMSTRDGHASTMPISPRFTLRCAPENAG